MLTKSNDTENKINKSFLMTCLKSMMVITSAVM